MKQSIIDAYMRGFRVAVVGEMVWPPGAASGAWKNGFHEGVRVLKQAHRAAKLHADRVLKSPAMQQAKRNAEVGK